MSVIITSMEKPKTCKHCYNGYSELSPHKGYGDCKLGNANYIRHEVAEQSIADGCPLKTIQGLISFIESKSYNIGNETEKGMTISDIRRYINEYCEVD